MKSYSISIQERRKVAESTIEVRLSLSGQAFDFNAGEYVRVTLPKLLHEDPRGDSRNFSIASSPNSRDSLIVTFRESESGFKRSFVELPIGTEVLVEGPFGVFVLPKQTKRPLVFIAGGIGISPFLSMIRFATEKKLPYKMTLLYANTDPGRAIYLTELKELGKKNQLFVSKNKFGDITQAFIKEATKDLQRPLWYVAGPPAMVQASRNLLLTGGVKEEDISTEEMSGYVGGVHLSSYSGLAQKDSGEQLLVRKNISGPLLEVLDQTALVAITDVMGDIIYVNNKFVEISKYGRDELMGENHRILKSGHHNQSFYEDLWKTIADGKIWRGEIKNRAKDGSFYWVDSVIAPIFDDNGKISHYIAVRFPITDRKKAEKRSNEKAEELTHTVEEIEEKNTELQNIRRATLNLLEDLDEEKKEVEKKVLDRTLELEQEKNKLLQVTSNMKGGGILLNEKREVIFVNDQALDMLSLENDGKNEDILEVFFKKFDSADIRGHLKRCIKGETFSVPEAESEEKIFEIFFHALNELRSDKKIISGYFILFFDVTEAKLLERSKSELVAVASHQLRTPLTAIRGNIEMLADESFGKLNKEQHELLDDIEISSVRLISMVNDMLDITKIEKGYLEMVPEILDLEEIIRSVLSDLGDYAKRHEFRTEYHRSSEAPIVHGDRLRLRQVFQNLIDNAIKYSRHPGKVDISYNISDKNIEVILKDNGIGIPKGEQSKMFEQFYRATNTSKTASSGSGLGLYIVKSVVEQLGGSVRFESEEDVGTTFFVTLPRKKEKINSK